MDFAREVGPRWVGLSALRGPHLPPRALAPSRASAPLRFAPCAVSRSRAQQPQSGRFRSAPLRARATPLGVLLLAKVVKKVPKKS